MMINKKNCILIVLLVLVALPRNSKSIFQRLTKRSTDDGTCEQSTAAFCTKIMNNENGLLQHFLPDTSHSIQSHYLNATANCKVLLCVMTMYAVIIESEKYFPNSAFISDEAFVNVIKGSSLAECYDNRNNDKTDDNHTQDIYKSAVDDISYTTDESGNVDFNYFESTSTQQDTQSIKSNEIDGSLDESKHELRKGIIDILYTNENYTNAVKSKYVNEQTDTELLENNPWIENASVVGGIETTIAETTPQFFYNSGEKERSELDVANRIDVTGTTTVANEDTVSISDFPYVSSSITSTSNPLDSTDVDAEGVATSSGSYLNNNKDETKRILTLESSAMSTTNKSALSQIGNVIFQLLGEEGYNSFSCNLTTAGEDDITNDNGGNVFHRRANKSFESNAALEKIEFDSLPEIPKSIRDDPQMKFLLVEFKIFKLCNFTSENHQNWTENISKKLILCSNGISKLKLKVGGETKEILEKYSQDILSAVKKFKVMQESKMKIIKIINLTDYLSSTIKESDIPKNLQNNFLKLKQFLLVELKNEDLSTFHPNSNRKEVFMVQMFDYLIRSKVVDDKKKKLLEMFKKFIRNVS